MRKYNFGKAEDVHTIRKGLPTLDLTKKIFLSPLNSTYH